MNHLLSEMVRSRSRSGPFKRADLAPEVSRPMPNNGMSTSTAVECPFKALTRPLLGRFLPICRTFLGDFAPGELDSRSLQTPGGRTPGGIPGTRSTLQHEQDADRRRTVPMGIHSESTPRVLRTEKQDGYPFTTFLGDCQGITHYLRSSVV